LQRGQIDEAIGDFAIGDVPVVALSGFVVIPQPADPFRYEREAVFEAVAATSHRLAHPPDNHLDERCFGQGFALAQQQRHVHVGVDTNTDEPMSNAPTRRPGG
jgi:hypothetical protein